MVENVHMHVYVHTYNLNECIYSTNIHTYVCMYVCHVYISAA